MDLKIPKHHHAPPVFQSNRESPLEGNSSNPFAYTFLDHTDPLCKLNLKETADFVKAFPMAKSSSTQVSRAFLENPTTTTLKRREETGAVAHRRLEAPPTPGRPPVFPFNGVVSESMRSPICNFSSRKSFPSKWDDAQKWLINSSSDESPHTHMIKPLEPFFKQNQTISHQEKEIPAKETSDSNGFLSDVLLKDKFTDNVVEKNLQNLRYPEVGLKEGFLFRNSSCCESMKDACTEVVAEVQHRDIGTEMTPLGSSTTSRCHTPLKSSSPARHNTPTTRSGPLASSNSSIDISGLQDCHFAQFQAVDKSGSCWSSREEEEEDISKSLRHSEIGTFRKSVGESQSRATAWEDEERTKCCIRYQREEAKIQAWVNLQSAKAEAQSRKLEVKIEKMRSNLEEKLMKRMAVVHRKAEEWRASAQVQHNQQMPSAAAASQQSQKLKIQSSSYSSEDKSSCGCFFPCNSY